MTPAHLVQAASETDVADAFGLAREQHLPVAVRSGGHDFVGRSSTSGVLVDLGGLTGTKLDGETATIGGGARLGDVYRELAAHGRAIAGGCGDTVGVAGLTLGGGLGVLGRRYGLTCDRLRAARIVRPDGETVRCTADENPDLLWALRGGGHQSVGVVTELEFDTVPAPACVAFTRTGDAVSAGRALAAWQALAPEADPRLAVSLHLDAPAGGPVSCVVLGIAHELEPAAVRGFLDEILAPDVSTTHLREAPWLEAKALLAEWGWGPGEPRDEHSRSEFFAESLPDGAIAALVDNLTAGRTAGESRQLDLSPWGGVYAAPASDATAFPHREARFLLKHAATGRPDWVDASWTVAHPYGTGGVYPNFPDLALADAPRAYWGDNLDRLRAINQRCDPDGLLPPLGGRAVVSGR